MRYVPDARKALGELKLEAANELDEKQFEEERKDGEMIKGLAKRAKNKNKKD